MKTELFTQEIDSEKTNQSNDFVLKKMKEVFSKSSKISYLYPNLNLKKEDESFFVNNWKKSMANGDFTLLSKTARALRLRNVFVLEDCLNFEDSIKNDKVEDILGIVKIEENYRFVLPKSDLVLSLLDLSAKYDSKKCFKFLISIEFKKEKNGIVNVLQGKILSFFLQNYDSLFKNQKTEAISFLLHVVKDSISEEDVLKIFKFFELNPENLDPFIDNLSENLSFDKISQIPYFKFLEKVLELKIKVNFYKAVELRSYISGINNFCLNNKDKYSFLKRFLDLNITGIDQAPYSVNLFEDLSKQSLITNKALKREFYSKLFYEKGSERILLLGMVRIIRDILESKEIDQQLLLPFIKDIRNFSIQSIDKNRIDVKSIYESKIIQNIFNNSTESLGSLLTWNQKSLILKSILSLKENEYIKDTNYMIEAFERKRKNIDRYLIEVKRKNPRSLKELHNCIQFWQEVGELQYIPDSDLKKIESQKVGDFYIYIPKSNIDLFEYGQKMKICVGNGSYFKKIVSKQSQIIFLKKENSPIYCVEYDYSLKKIIQAKGFLNKEMPFFLQYKLNSLINPSFIKKIMNKIFKTK